MEKEIIKLVSQYIEGKISSEDLSKAMTKFDTPQTLQNADPEIVALISQASGLHFLEQNGDPSHAKSFIEKFYKENKQL